MERKEFQFQVHGARLSNLHLVRVSGWEIVRNIQFGLISHRLQHVRTGRDLEDMYPDSLDVRKQKSRGYNICRGHFDGWQWMEKPRTPHPLTIFPSLGSLGQEFKPRTFQHMAFFSFEYDNRKLTFLNQEFRVLDIQVLLSQRQSSTRDGGRNNSNFKT